VQPGSMLDGVHIVIMGGHSESNCNSNTVIGKTAVNSCCQEQKKSLRLTINCPKEADNVRHQKCDEGSVLIALKDELPHCWGVW